MPGEQPGGQNPDHRGERRRDRGDLDRRDEGVPGRAGEEQPARRALDIHQQAADALAGLIFLTGDLLLAGHDGLGFAQIDIEIIALAAAHGAGDDIADLVLEIVVDAVLLELPEALHHGLAGSLRRDAAQRGGIDFLFQHFTDQRAGLHGLRLFHVDLGLRVAHRVDHLHQGPRVELPVLGVDIDLELLTRVHAFLRRGLQGIRDRGDHIGTRDALLLLHVFQDGKNFAAHEGER